MPDTRTPCINPRCRRTFKADERHSEVVCGKCFRTVPLAVRSEFNRCWREYRKWDRRIKRTGDVLKAQRMHDIRGRFGLQIDRHWAREIKPFFLTPDKPEGLDAFLEEVGL